MTAKEFAKQHLVVSGLSETDAETVLNETIKNDMSFSGRWNHDVNEYPPMIFTLIKISVNAEALKWCDANCPEAWFKPMFMTQAQRKELEMDF